MEGAESQPSEGTISRQMGKWATGQQRAGGGYEVFGERQGEQRVLEAETVRTGVIRDRAAMDDGQCFFSRRIKNTRPSMLGGRVPRYNLTCTVS